MSEHTIISGWGQVKQGKNHIGPLLTPLDLMAKASKRAAGDVGNRDILAALDGIIVVRVMSQRLPSAAEQLAAKIGANPRLLNVTGIGGNSPQQSVNWAATMIAEGKLDSILIAGAETYYPRNRGDISGEEVLFKGFNAINEREDMKGVTQTEADHGIFLPVHGFPLYETALWGQSGLDLKAYSKRVGRLWSRFSQVASEHPCAWLQKPRSADDILKPSAKNRMVAFPYTKFMTSMVFVDLGAAVILMSETKARRWCQNRSRPVYFLGGAVTEDTQPYPIQKSSFTTSISLQTAVSRALERSNLTPDEIDVFDLYSCFPAAVTIARQMIGIREEDTRPLTLTGGLGFFGGPGNNYSLHAIATMAASIADGRYNTGMVTSLGWFMHKHAVGVYGSRPPEQEASNRDHEKKAGCLVGSPPEKISNQISDTGTIETYTVLYNREGAWDRAVIYGKTENGDRFIAQTPRDTDIYADLTTTCHVGRKVRLHYRPGEDCNTAEIL